MKLLYNLGILIYNLLVHLAAPFYNKAGLWVTGRRNWQEKIRQKIHGSDRTIWIHCASLGEFEQGRPVIEDLKNNLPGTKIVLTFFSPSGYEIRKNYSFADCVSYLPADTVKNAREFLEIIHPEKAIFVKYEFWNNYLTQLNEQEIPVYLISGIFRPGQHFFRWYGAFFRQILRKFEKIFVQDQESYDLLKGIGIDSASVAGDTRYDRVVQISTGAKEIPVLRQFRGEEKLFLAGSSWKGDEEIISKYINRYPGRMKWVFAPHEIEPANVDRLEKLFSARCVRFSKFTDGDADARVLIIDNIGMLSSAYRYAAVAAIGGGFGKGIHNVLEAACWGIPVMFGPRYRKFREAVQLISEGGAASFDSFDSFSAVLDRWLDDVESYRSASGAALENVRKNTGATAIIAKELLNGDFNRNGKELVQNSI